MRSFVLAMLTVLNGTMWPWAAGPGQASDGARVRVVADGPTIAQVQYDGGGDWYANPSSLPNLLHEIRVRTGLPVASRPAHVRLTDPDLWRYPYLYVTGHGNIRLSEAEIRSLRRYLAHGGFLHVDDNYGLDRSFRREIRRVFPDRPLVPLPADNPVYHVFYDLPDGLPKIHEHDGLPAQGFGIFEKGRLVVFYSYQSDLGDGWEDADVHGDPPEKREAAFRMGVNLFLYAMAQGVT
ncbi:MAG: DUF4159 domain-containing protein [Gemmatimonadota bacterium]|jgi:hypothetical protein